MEPLAISCDGDAGGRSSGRGPNHAARTRRAGEGAQNPELPLLGAVDMKISGMTEATRQRVADVPLGELDLPVVVRGYVCDGFVDSFVFDDNEVSFGRNEAGAVWVDGDEDGLSALGKAGHFTDPRDTAEQVLRDEVDPMTLARARLQDSYFLATRATSCL